MSPSCASSRRVKAIWNEVLTCSSGRYGGLRNGEFAEAGVTAGNARVL